MPEEAIIRISGLMHDSIVDGVGLRFVVFTQGCPHHCPGCHNPDTHDPSGGRALSAAEIMAEIDGDPLISGVTLSGGEPFFQAKALIPLAEGIKGRGLHLAAYSGYTFEEIVSMGGAVAELLGLCDVLVDGRFINSERTLNRRFVGSGNQRCLDVKKSLAAGAAVLAEHWQ